MGVESLPRRRRHYGAARLDTALRAWIRQASGDPGGALAAIAEAGQASPGPAGPLNPVPAGPLKAGRGSVTAVPGLAEPLTSRDLEVLTMLAAGRPNQATASQLVVTLDTVKKHVSHVLGKLGAANRTEAVSRARELSLMP